jgi:hypothetical protein
LDETSLARALDGGAARQCWFKPVGDPEAPANEQETFAKELLSIEFAKEPVSVRVGDLLIVSRIGVSKIIYVARCRSAARPATEEEIQRERWRSRWRWTISAENLTPEYGRVWNRYSLKPFALAKEYSRAHPASPVSIEGARFGSDKILIRREFAEFVIGRIGEL